MVIEWLQFRVEPTQRQHFIQADAEIWTTTLAAYPGFLSKEVWLEPDQDDRVTLVIRWQTREQWHAVPAEVLRATEARFAAAVRGDYQLLAAQEYQVRKFAP